MLDFPNSMNDVIAGTLKRLSFEAACEVAGD
jgi:hypothetical protein